MVDKNNAIKARKGWKKGMKRKEDAKLRTRVSSLLRAPQGES